jgi:hypothetical protein
VLAWFAAAVAMSASCCRRLVLAICLIVMVA